MGWLRRLAGAGQIYQRDNFGMEKTKVSGAPQGFPSGAFISGSYHRKSAYPLFGSRDRVANSQGRGQVGAEEGREQASERDFQKLTPPPC